MPEPIATFNIKTAGRVYNQTNEFVYLRGNVNHNAHEEDRFDWICGPHEGHETAEVRDVWKTGGGRGLRGGSPKRVGGVFVDDRIAFGISADQWKTATQCKGE